MCYFVLSMRIYSCCVNKFSYILFTLWAHVFINSAAMTLIIVYVNLLISRGKKKREVVVSSEFKNIVSDF